MRFIGPFEGLTQYASSFAGGHLTSLGIHSISVLRLSMLQKRSTPFFQPNSRQG